MVTLLFALAAVIYAVSCLVKVAWRIVVDHRNHVLSEPDGPRCRECLRCASCRRPMAEDGTPRPNLKTVR